MWYTKAKIKELYIVEQFTTYGQADDMKDDDDNVKLTSYNV